MPQFIASKKTIDDFNNAEKFVDGDGLPSETVNNLVEGLLYAQDNPSGGSGGGSSVTLSKNYGESDVNGYVQTAVNGVAQSKNYYNLGAFDIYVSNGDGTGTITRQTGYTRLLDLRAKNAYSYYTAVEPTADPANAIENLGNAVSSFGPNVSYGQALNGQRGVSLTYVGSFAICFGADSNINSVEAANAYLIQNPVWIQYQLKSEYRYTEKVIENRPIHIANQEEGLYWNDEFKKSLNLINDLGIYESAGINFIENNGAHLKIQVTNSDPFIRSNFLNNLPSGTYTITSNIGEAVIWQTINGQETQRITFTVPQDKSTRTDIHLEFEGLSVGATYDIYLMLVRATTPYPYSEYNGKLLHQKDLSKATEELTDYVDDKFERFSDRPSVAGIQFNNGNNFEYAGITSSGGRVGSQINELSATDYYNPQWRITCLPVGSQNSVARVDFSYSGSGKDIIEYKAEPQQSSVLGAINLLCVTKTNASIAPTNNRESGYTNHQVSITANITDIYGKKETINWTVSFSAK